MLSRQERLTFCTASARNCTILGRPTFLNFHLYETPKETPLRLIGCLLLLSGFFIVVAALVLMPSLPARLTFVGAGLGVEMLGVGLLTQAYKADQKEHR